jgi:signal peptide peptidase SppA
MIDRARLLVHAQSEIWAILPDVLRAALINFSGESIVEAREGQPQGIAPTEREAVTRPGPKSGRLARVPIFGAITHRDTLWSLLFGGGPTVERLTQTLRDLGNDPSISTVMLEIDSPGGTVSGMPELAAEVRALAEKRHVVALANSLTASAAYWLASQADEIVATPEALVGSIGVFTMHEDYSQMMESMGVKTTYISAGKYKTEANPDQPLSAEAQAHLQSIVDDVYGLFVGDVARGRGVTPATVRSDYGQGRVLTAGDAKTAGMIDRVATSDETIRRLVGTRAEGDGFPPEARGNDTEGKRLALLRRRLELAEKS